MRTNQLEKIERNKKSKCKWEAKLGLPFVLFCSCSIDYIFECGNPYRLPFFCVSGTNLVPEK